MRRTLIIGLLTASLCLGLPEAAHACPVCFDANGEVRWAFIVTTAFLTFLPLAMVGGTGLWMRKKYREMRKTEDATPEVRISDSRRVFLENLESFFCYSITNRCHSV